MEMLLTIDQTAEKLSLHHVTVRRLLREGKLRGIKKGRQWRVPESALCEARPETQPEPEKQAAQIIAALDKPEERLQALQCLVNAPDEVKRHVWKGVEKAR